MKAKKYSFRSKIWKYKGPNGWHFVTLPKRLALKIRKSHFTDEEGWGRLPAMASIGETSWKTAIWYDTKAKSYLLPIKAIVRSAQKLESGKMAQVTLLIQLNDFRFSLFR